MTQVTVLTTKHHADRQIPSILSYVEGEELHGAQAKAQLVRNPKNTVAYFRDFLGKEYVQEPSQEQEHAECLSSFADGSCRDTPLL